MISKPPFLPLLLGILGVLIAAVLLILNPVTWSCAPCLEAPADSVARGHPDRVPPNKRLKLAARVD